MEENNFHIRHYPRAEAHTVVMFLYGKSVITKGVLRGILSPFLANTWLRLTYTLLWLNTKSRQECGGSTHLAPISSSLVSPSKRSRKKKKLIFILFSYLPTHLHSQPSFSLREQNFASKGRFRLACCVQWCDAVSTLCTDIFIFSRSRLPYQLRAHLAVCCVFVVYGNAWKFQPSTTLHR